MAKAVFNGVVIAESKDTKRVEGNHYFPPESVNMQFFTPTERHTICPWKGQASYYTVEVNGKTAENAAWHYPDTSQAARHIRDHIAFYPVVRVID